ncbi:MAG: hypothetical protein ABEJ65_12505, partial [bacterium]
DLPRQYGLILIVCLSIPRLSRIENQLIGLTDGPWREKYDLNESVPAVRILEFLNGLEVRIVRSVPELREGDDD